MKFYYPVDPDTRVSQDYTPNHRAIDFAVMTGTRVMCAQVGRVISVRDSEHGYGVHVRVEHSIDGEDRTTIYAHLSKYNVKPGDILQIGAVIGLSGNTGNSSGPHLHFEVRNGHGVYTSPIDPRPLLEWDDGEGEPPDPDDWPEFPELPQAHVISTAGLYVRTGAGTGFPVAGLLKYGDVVDAIGTVKNGDDIWLRLGWRQFSAYRYRGAQYAEWVE